MKCSGVSTALATFFDEKRTAGRGRKLLFMGRGGYRSGGQHQQQLLEGFTISITSYEYTLMTPRVTHARYDSNELFIRPLQDFIHRCIFRCMRTNIVLNDELMHEAMRYSRSRSKTGLVEEALNLFVTVKAREQQLASYSERLHDLQHKLGARKFRESGMAILEQDRERK